MGERSRHWRGVANGEYMTVGRRLVCGGVLAIVVGCGGRTGLFSFESGVPTSSGAANGGANANLGGAGTGGSQPGTSAVATPTAGTSSHGGCSGTLLLGTAPGIALPDASSNYDVASRIAVGDFDGDHRPDVIAIDQSRGSTIVRLYHREAGLKFGAAVELKKNVGPIPEDILARDFTGDGMLDVAIAGDNSVLLLRQGTAGALEPAGSFPVISAVDRIASGDLNGDGRSDLVVTTLARDSVSVLLAEPSGGFAPRVDYASGFQSMSGSASAPIVADFNGDGYDDIAATDPPAGRVSVFFSGALGPFATRLDVPVGAVPRGLATADFDRDGALDIATSGEGTISVRRNQGHGTFDAAHEYPMTGVFSWLGSADLNEDGVPDLVAVGDGVAVLLGRGDGTFENPTQHGWGKFGSAAISDIDGDGHLDLVVTQVGVVVLLGDGYGGFVGPITSPSAGNHGWGIAAGDVNRDGQLDLVVANPGEATTPNDPGSNFNVLLGDGTGHFSSRTARIGGPGVNLNVLADFDGDGLLDAITTADDGATVTVARGQGDGTFKSEPASFSANESYGFQASDLNADGYQDLVYLISDSLMIALNDRRGGFLTPTRYQLAQMFGSAVAVDIADHDGDGILDAAVEEHEPDALLLYAGDGTGAFHLRSTVNLPYWPAGVSSGDLNGDGLIDFAVADGQGATVLLAEPDASFRTMSIDLQVGETSRIHVLDMNGDHVPDIVSRFRDGLSVALGVGDGTFATPALPYQVGTWIHEAVGDFNHDGAPDFAFASPDSAAVLLNGCRN